MSRMDFLSSKASLEACDNFMRRLKNDGRLMKIINENDVDIEDVLYFIVDEARLTQTIGINWQLAMHLYNKKNIKLFNIAFDVHEQTIQRDNGGFDLVLHVNCYMRYDVTFELPTLLNIDDAIRFTYTDRLVKGFNTRRVPAFSRFTTDSWLEIVSYMFAIMHKTLDENEKENE